MDGISFPKRKKNKKKGLSGQTFFQHFITEELECIYHPIPEENDFGIDGYIEFVENEQVTGRLLAAQIKHGDSFFENKIIGGFKYYGENKHLNYYLNNNSPVIIVILNDDFSKKLWVLFDISTTLPTEKGWWLEIPSKNIISKDVYSVWQDIAGRAIDYEDEIKLNWQIDKAIQTSSFRLIYIPKKEILEKRYDFITSFFQRITKNKEMMIKSRASLDIFFPEFDDNSRGIFEIPEIMEWLNNSIEIGIPWFYFLRHESKSAGLKLLLHSYITTERITRKEKGYLVEFANKDFANFLKKNFINLNRFTETNDISIEINKEISAGIFELYNRETISID